MIDDDAMTSSGAVSLSHAVPRARRRLAAMLSPTAAVLLVAGVLSLVLHTGVIFKIIGALILAFSVLLLLIVSGLRRLASTAEAQLREAELDAAILAASPGCGGDCTSCAPDDCAVKALPRI